MKPEKLSDFEIKFFEGLIKKDPNYIDALRPLAEGYTQRKEYKKGLLIDQQLAKLCPEDPVVYYNLACSFALVVQKRKALETLQKAVDLGYRDFDYIKSDSDLASLHDDPSFIALIQQKK